MEFFKRQTNIDFLGARKIAFAISIFLIAASLYELVDRGLNFGIDFTGGVLIEVGYPEDVVLEEVRDTVAEVGYGGATVQHFGTLSDVLIRLQPQDDRSSAEISEQVLSALRQSNAGVEMRRVEFVGPQVGDELKAAGGNATLVALLMILFYVSMRFQWKLATGAVAALAHDVIITLGYFSLFSIPFDLTVLAALLAVIGYSLNDTIVVFDRIRENFRVQRKGTAISVANASINQTMSRTIMTGLTTMLVLAALFYFGGEVIHAFALALILGVVIGTYSSIYVASTVAVMLGVTKQDLLPVKKEDAVDDLP